MPLTVSDMTAAASALACLAIAALGLFADDLRPPGAGRILVAAGVLGALGLVAQLATP